MDMKNKKEEIELAEKEIKKETELSDQDIESVNGGIGGMVAGVEAERQYTEMV